jgi:hypothetical protein
MVFAPWLAPCTPPRASSVALGYRRIKAVLNARATSGGAPPFCAPPAGRPALG